MARTKSDATRAIEIRYEDMDVLKTLNQEGGNAFAVDLKDVQKWLFANQTEIAEQVKRNTREMVLARFGAVAGIKTTVTEAIEQTTKGKGKANNG